MANNTFTLLKRAIDKRDISSWQNASERLANERKAIEGLLESGGDAYGFTSLFGPLDTIDASDGYQSSLLQWHLIGCPSEIPRRAGDWISAVKLQQLSLGGSGLSPETYLAILNRFAGGISYSIDLDASYSSADVVPASWWVHSVLDDSHPIRNNGDLIALINGNFVSIGLLAYATERLINCLCTLLATPATVGFKGYGQTHSQTAIVRSLNIDAASNNRPQQSVLSRDCIPIISGILQEISRSVEVVSSASTRKSCNPVFKFDSNDVVAISNSSFLDFSAASASLGLAHATRLAARLLNKVVSTACVSAAENDKDNPRWVQYPKVTLGYCIAIEGGEAGPMQMTGSESGGVEDLWDTGLASTNQLLNQLKILDKELSVSLECLSLANLNPKKTLTFDELLSLCEKL